MTIECDVTANPPANITWFKRTSERVRMLTSNSKSSITPQLTYTQSGPLSSSTLTVRDVVQNDNGNYICEARNNRSSSKSTNFDFIVISMCLKYQVYPSTTLMYTTAHNECILDSLGSSPCQNGALCVDRINSYTCNCNGRYTGVNCSEEGNTSCGS